jgi:CelD/BcsL family acetyltransferase involved in cellulose biosynthesis
MSVDVRRATGDDRERWDGLVERSPHGTPFHLDSFARVAAEYADLTYVPLIGYVGQEPVGLFPTFRQSHGPVTTVVSPPPDLQITYQGPAMVNIEKLKQRKADRRHRQFVEGCLDYLEKNNAPRYMHVRTASRYIDTRPFVQQGFDASLGHTYVVDITPDEEALLGRFSSDARGNATGEYDGVTISVGGAAGIRQIIDQVRERHEAQGEPFTVPTSFVVNLWRELPDGVLRPYVCEVNGEFAGGMVTLEYGETVYRWLGGAKHDADVPVNDLVDWQIIRGAKSRGVARYDLVGANQPNIARYKAKFAPELELYQQLERGTVLMKMASNVYKRVRK